MRMTRYGLGQGRTEMGNGRRRAWVFFCTFLFAGFSFVWAGGALTFEDRVNAQEAIERVYYNHRIWPKENPGPRPPFDQMISRVQIEAKVDDYLKKSAALDKYWQRPLSANQLQAELNRMARQTQDPDTLRELFAALNNDPYLIAECLARSLLADRLIRNWYAYDSRFHSEARKRTETALNILLKSESCTHLGLLKTMLAFHRDRNDSDGNRKLEVRDSEECALSDEQFEQYSNDIPAEGEISGVEESLADYFIIHTLRKTDRIIEFEIYSLNKMPFEEWLSDLCNFSIFHNSSIEGSKYSLPLIAESPTRCGWDNAILSHVAPVARRGHTSVWTGTEMIVWGGWNNHGWLFSGGRYNPIIDDWLPVGASQGIHVGEEHTAIWTGTEMIIWGGYSSLEYFNTGGRYNPLTNSWTPTTTKGFVPLGRRYHTAVWTGSEMIIWGGYNKDSYPACRSGGGRYNPSNDQWSPTSTPGYTQLPRMKHTAVWTGHEMIVWGGLDESFLYTNTGEKYNPDENTCTLISTGVDVPSARYMHTAIWTGSEMIVWGGFDNTGGRYNSATDFWVATPLGENAPIVSWGHTAVWTGKEMIIWGGRNVETSQASNEGARYNPNSDNWIPISLGTNVPKAREEHSAIWTGTEMIVWGGDWWDGSHYLLNSGGRYEPLSDSWMPTSVAGSAPEARTNSSAVWTGVEMIVWGGSALQTGGRYSLAVDAWTPTSTGTNVPSGRSKHTAVWTGTKMIVWGGYDSQKNGLNTGGLYDPILDAWNSTSVGICVPSERKYHTAVWTGSTMIIWGGSGTNTGGRYNPTSNVWDCTSTADKVPSGRYFHTAVWAGNEMIIWGGASMGNVNTGGKYDPIKDSWQSTSINGAPSSRSQQTAIWTGQEMIIWGGYSDVGSYYLDTGGQYNPITDSWIPTPADAQTPSARTGHTAVWTGKEMIIWGGRGNTGGRYDPIVERWLSTPVDVGISEGRSDHAAVWTGTSMIVWGGSYLESVLASGGIYFPCASHARPAEKP